MRYLHKLKNLIGKKPKKTEYSFYKFFVMCLQLYIYTVGLNLTGLKIYSIDVASALNSLNPSSMYGLEYAYYCGIHGLFMGLAVFRLFELYWYAKDVNEVLYTVTV